MMQFHTKVNQSGEVVLESVEGNDEIVTIPDEVTVIGKNAMGKIKGVKEVRLPDGIKRIEGGTRGGAFSGCANLQAIVLPDGLEIIEGYTFSDCTSLQSITLPNELKEIHRYAFSGCINLQTMNLPDGLERIEGGAFSGCTNLTSFTLPDEFGYIYQSTFEGCTNLQEITLPVKLKEIGESAFFGCTSLQTIIMPKELRIIKSQAFSGCTSLKTITFSNGLKEIGGSAFRGCTSLISITMPDGMETIEAEAFSGCTGLQSIALSNGIKEIKRETFSRCTSLQTIVLPDGIKEIGNNAFGGCSALQSITLPDGLEKIGYGAFLGCTDLRSIVLPDGIKQIGKGIFINCTNLNSIILSDGLNVIEENAFSGCTNLQSITLSSGIKTIKQCAFSGCTNLRSISLPAGLAYIHKGAFSDCINLASIILPDGLKQIGKNAFSDCTSLKSITLPDTLEMFSEDAFSGCGDLQIHVNFRTTKPLPIGIWSLNLSPSDEEIAWLWLYQDDKQWRTNLEKMKIENPDRVFDHMIALQKESGSKPSATLVQFMKKHVRELRPEQLRSAFDWLEEKKYRGIQKLREDPLFESVLSGEAPKKSYFSTINRKVSIPGLGEFNFRTKDTLPAQLAEQGLNLYDEEIAYVALYQRSGAWNKWLNRVRLDDPVHVFNCMTELWLQDKSVTAKLTSFMIDHVAKLQMEQVQEVVSILQKRGTKAQIQSVMDCPEVALLAKGEPLPKHPIEALVSKLVPFYVREIGQIDEIVHGVHYADSELRSSRDAVVLLIAAGFCEADQKIDNFGEGSNMHIKGKLCLDDDLLRVANALNRSELLEQLVNLYKNAKTQNMKYLLAWALLADDASIRKETMYFKEKREGKRQPIAEVYATRFLMYNDSLAAMQLFDRLNMLDEYAQMRGMTAMEMRDSTMLPDFHFDADGAKRYDIGGNTIEVRITPELKFQLRDVNKGKELRSFPKKSDDPEKLATCAAEFDKFKWEALSLAKERAQLLHKLHMSGEFIQPELWHKVYVEHQLIRHLAQLVVWEDRAKRTFMTVDGETIDSQGQPYSPQGAICVAHVLDMTAEDIAAWQLWLTKQGRKQLFEQVWEPVILWDKDGIQSRYDGVVLSSSARNAVKKHLAQRGVDVWAEDMARSYDRRTNSFSFSNKSVLHFGHCLSLNYIVDDASRETTFGLTHDAALTAYRRELNAVLLEMDRAAISAQILKDSDAALTDAALANFTAAQISEFLNLAIDQKSTRCTAKLLDYKNQRFPEFSEVDEFTLDW